MMQELRDILLVQKREIDYRLSEKYVERTTTIQLQNDLIKVIIGPRRAGKSFYALHLLRTIGEFGYINFDDERLMEVHNYDDLIAALNTVYHNPRYVLLDEIQNLPKWELFVNRLQRQGLRVILTGSNSKLLSKELSTHLTGRHAIVTIFPFSFKEFLALEQKDYTSAELNEKLSTYLVNGGYPEPLVKQIDGKEYLSVLFNSIVYKDIVQRYKIRRAKELEDLAYYFISNIATEYSYHLLTKATTIKSSHTTRKYDQYLEEAFILFSLPRFSHKVKEQLSSNKKMYCIDNGFIQAKGFSLSPDFGRLYENTVACALKQEETTGRIAVYYWKNQQQEEVDFVIERGARVEQLIQVCYDLTNPETKNREIRALLKAGKELHCKDLMIITKDKEDTETIEWFGDTAVVSFIPLRKWLLEMTGLMQK